MKSKTSGIDYHGPLQSTVSRKNIIGSKTLLAIKTLLDEIARYEFAQQIGFNTQINFYIY